MLGQQQTSKFKKQIRKLDLRQRQAAQEVVILLLNEMPLSPKHRRHTLVGNFSGLEECHVRPDLLIIFKIENNILTLYQIGNHAELFE